VLFRSGRAVNLGVGGGTFDLQGNADVTLTGNVAGAGAFVKQGSGTLMLSGANTYTGPTLLAGGALRAGAANVFGINSATTLAAGSTLDLNDFSQSLGSLSGNGNVTLGSGTLTTGGNNASTIFTGSISGSGGFVKAGTGVLALTGANTYSGGTTVSGGALVGTTTSLQGNITNNALVVFAQNSSGSYSGTMNGSGSLFKLGTGTLTLNGSNTYSGGTLISGNGAVAIARDSALGAATGAVALGDGSSRGTLIFSSGSSFSAIRGFHLGAAGGTFDTGASSAITLNGSIGGSGALTKTGAGTLTLAGANTYSGGTIEIGRASCRERV